MDVSLCCGIWGLLSTYLLCHLMVTGAGSCTKEATMITFMSALREVIILCAYKAKNAYLHTKGADWQCYGYNFPRDVASHHT